VAAFDDLNRSQAENNVFGNDESDSLYFDLLLAGLLADNQETYAAYSDWDASYVAAYTADLQAVDKMGNGLQYRMNRYNPMYYRLEYYAGVERVDFATVWNQGHTMAERTGNATENFIARVVETVNQ